ncbi:MULTISPECIES: hypothetical protein [unclassified Bradyrhizobium]|uniref:hypothetical protein n=1 Tax=unclassified Bradyrhizobium TaxID=2631580 RepID=UPI001FF032CE|nr:MULTISPECIES: hypothetical protein [unclassified Bradyrhizobium]
MNTAPDLTISTAIAATDQTKAAATPRIKLLSHGFSIDHPDPELGERMASLPSPCRTCRSATAARPSSATSRSMRA